MARLLERYRKEIVPRLQKELGYENALAVPRVDKIVVSMGVGEAKTNRQFLDSAAKDLTLITGQKPLVTKARQAVAGFKIRLGQEIGLKVTLRRRRMYEFLDRLVSIAIPRIRDFRGLSADSFDEAGNYSFGLTEQAVFPEITIDKVERVQGMNVTICIRSRRPQDARALLTAIGFPFRR